MEWFPDFFSKKSAFWDFGSYVYEIHPDKHRRLLMDSDSLDSGRLDSARLDKTWGRFVKQGAVLGVAIDTVNENVWFRGQW